MCGMMSAGMIGFPGLGYAKDRFTAEHLQKTPQGQVVLDKNKSEDGSKFQIGGIVVWRIADGKIAERWAYLGTPTSK